MNQTPFVLKAIVVRNVNNWATEVSKSVSRDTPAGQFS